MKHRKPSVVLALELMQNCAAGENAIIFEGAGKIIESCIENLYTDVMGSIASEKKPLDSHINSDQAEKYKKIVDKTREFIDVCYECEKNPFIYKEVEQPSRCCFLFFSCSYTSPYCFDDTLLTDESPLKEKYNSFLSEIRGITLSKQQAIDKPIYIVTHQSLN